ncbi:phosphotransferase family protein [Nocardioides massiliensis]|uniref:Aminoglycoside phosphotransferase (APT) family kinase protein n=1 Tax=Nocardioides massiliensis TaxID=1325935 RepID=A0ABT9NUF2_9ACTN|nr:phosphotransferase [Nocardioides massiliensis]MDP9823907.1 aminoglycoside phosphotransferase (APT) family kinase protein [Nocardioides massiliensis]
MSTPPAGVDDLTPQWLSAALDTRVDTVDATRIGTGQMGSCFRLHLDGPEIGGRVPATVLAKLPAEDPASRAMVAGTYRGEVRFYAEVAPTLDIRVPGCHHATEVDDEGRFALLLEDVAGGRVGDQLAGCTPAEAIAAAENLAGLHGPRWCDPTLAEIDGYAVSGPDDAALMGEFLPPAVDTFLHPETGIGALVSDEDAATLREASSLLPGFLLARPERFAVTHGDYRLDNLLFLPDGTSVALDWQTVNLGLPARDLAFLVTTGLPIEDRRACERDVVAAYHARLTSYGVAQGLEECWDDYRFAVLTGLLVEVFGCAFGARTDRGDRMFATMLARTCAAIRDLDTLALAQG